VIQFLIDENLTLVIGNWRDFEPMLQRAGVHPGAISLPTVPRAAQIRLFEAAIDYVEAGQPPLEMVNTVLVVDENGGVTQFELP